MDAQHQNDELQELTESTSMLNISVHNLSWETDSQMDSRSVLDTDSVGILMCPDQNVGGSAGTNNGAISLSPQLLQEQPCEDVTLASLLKSWELYDELYIFLKRKQINTEGLKYMNERHIDQLFCEFDDFNTKVIFEHRLGIWQNANGIYNLSQQPILTILSMESSNDDINSSSTSKEVYWD